MNYSESQEILKEIEKAKRIVINLHRGPDPDSFACAFGLYYFLCSLNKKVDVVLTKTSDLSLKLSKREEARLIQFVDYPSFNFSKYDLFISPDSGSWEQVTDNKDVKIPNIPIIIIDHHESNERFGKINLVDASAASCAQLIYLLFKDWDFYIDSKMADLIMSGIIADTGAFAFSNDSKSMKIAGELMDLGADKEKLILEEYRTQDFNQVRAWGEFLSRLQFDEKNKFIWTALSSEDYKKLKIPSKASSFVATQFANIVDGSDFGMIMVEDEKKSLKISFRSRSDLDVSKLAEMLGGGGHKKAAGGMVNGLSFEKAVEKVLETARKFAQNA